MSASAPGLLSKYLLAHYLMAVKKSFNEHLHSVALEIPVGDFIADAMKGDLPDVKGCKELLESNVKDEINHDIALDFAAKAHKISS